MKNEKDIQEAKPRRNLEVDRERFSVFESGLISSYGFDDLTPEFIEKENIEKGIGPLETARTKEVGNQIIFTKWIKGYRINIITSFDRDERKFTNSGRVWFNVVEEATDEAHYVVYFKRVGLFLETVAKETELWVNRLLYNRPLDSKNVPMFISYDYKTGDIWWKSKDGAETFNFFDQMPKDLFEYFKKRLSDKNRYFTIDRPRKKVKRFESEIRKKRPKLKSTNVAIAV